MARNSHVVIMVAIHTINVRKSISLYFPFINKFIKMFQFYDTILLGLNFNREAKSKGEKERYSHLNAEFQRIARRNKKAFLTDQCKETLENNRMGKTKDLSKKIRDTKGTFHAQMGSIKDKNDMDLTEAEDIKKRWQEYTEELYKKDLHGPDNHDGVITHLEPDILECPGCEAK